MGERRLSALIGGVWACPCGRPYPFDGEAKRDGPPDQFDLTPDTHKIGRRKQTEEAGTALSLLLCLHVSPSQVVVPGEFTRPNSLIGELRYDRPFS